jgi:RNA polymerase sigma factor (sigma-70 family)
MDVRNDTVVKHYKNNFESLCKSMERKAGGWHNAEDVVQEAYYRSLKHFKSFSAAKGSFDLWFPAILANCLRSHLRAEQLKGACIVNDEDLMEQPREGQQDNCVFADQIKQLLLSTENVDARTCLALYYFEGLPPSDIAKITSLTVTNIRVLVHRFQQEVRGLYANKK